MKVFLVADIGVEGGLFHVGDEAMMLAAIDELSARDVDAFVATSSTPDDTIERYPLASAIDRLDFSPSRTARREDREDRLDRITRSVFGETGLLAWDDPAWNVIEHIGDADAVLICGGGNLSSQWPEHVYERAAIGRIADALSKPIVTTGQTLGPAFTQRDGELVAELLGRSRLIGVREARSKAIAHDLGIVDRVVRTVDDATFLVDDPLVVDDDLPDRYCVVTLAPESGSSSQEQLIARTAAFLDDVVAVTDLDILMVPHHGSLVPGTLESDSAIHEQVKAATTSGRVSTWVLSDPKTTARLTRGAQLSVSTRYHPAVFALAAGVPSIVFAGDEYTDAKLSGALDNFGAGDGALSAIALVTSDAGETLRAIWAARDDLRRHLAAAVALRRADASSWWDAVATTLAGGEPPALAWKEVAQHATLDDLLRERNEHLRSWVSAEGRERIATFIASREGQEDIGILEGQVRAAEAALGDALGDLDAAQQRANEADAALSAAQDLMARLAEPAFVRTLRRTPAVEHADELQAVLNTRTFRWSRGPRAVYGALRRAFQKG